MLLACDTLKCSNALQKEPDLMVRRETSAAGIELLSTVCRLKPTENVLDDTLMELV